jgi:hypothetical protein
MFDREREPSLAALRRRSDGPTAQDPSIAAVVRRNGRRPMLLDDIACSLLK